MYFLFFINNVFSLSITICFLVGGWQDRGGALLVISYFKFHLFLQFIHEVPTERMLRLSDFSSSLQLQLLSKMVAEHMGVEIWLAWCHIGGKGLENLGIMWSAFCVSGSVFFPPWLRLAHLVSLAGGCSWCKSQSFLPSRAWLIDLYLSPSWSIDPFQIWL